MARLEKMRGTKWFSLIFCFAWIIFGICSRQYAFIYVFGVGMLLLLLIYQTAYKFLGRSRRIYQTVGILGIVIGGIMFGFLTRIPINSREGAIVWQMHTIDKPGYLIPNGLDARDVNGDGYDDYVTNYEWDGKIRIAFYPGVDKVSEPWPSITVGEISNAENAAFGDFDDDGNPDIVVCHGMETLSPNSGVFIIWNPGGTLSENPDQWIQSADIPGTTEGFQFNCVKSWDVNEDGIDDIVVGGRGTTIKAGVRWLEAPANPTDRRDLSKWNSHFIDATVEGAYGFIFKDIDNDGDIDLAFTNSDWDTPDSAKKIFYYANPGLAQITNPWQQIVIYQGNDIYLKEQMDFYDFSGDGFLDCMMQTDNEVCYFTNPADGPSDWSLFRIQKSFIAAWRARPIKIGDMNNDGRMDVVGMLIHRDGYFPATKASVFWMEYSGASPETGTWTTHVIKWSDGFFGLNTYNGEKWDQLLLVDVDQDGDLDVVGNCEEFHTMSMVLLSVVWFENPFIP